MRRPNHKTVNAVDHVRSRFLSRGEMNELEISVTQKDDGTLILEVESFDGNVLVLLPKGIPTEQK